MTLNGEWNLVVRTTNAAALHLKARADVLDAGLKHFQWVLTLEASGSLLECTVDSPLSNLFFAIQHRFVNQALHQHRLVLAVWLDGALEFLRDFTRQG